MMFFKLLIYVNCDLKINKIHLLGNVAFKAVPMFDGVMGFLTFFVLVLRYVVSVRLTPVIKIFFNTDVK